MAFVLDFSAEGFENIILCEKDEEVRLKTNVKTEVEALQWKQIFCRKNNMCLNVKRAYTSAHLKNTFHRKLMCHHGDKRHHGKKKLYTGCNLIVDIKIRVVTTKTNRKDPGRRHHPCVVLIKGTHNHPTESTTALKQLRVLPETKEEFYQYFCMGMSAPQAARYHKDKLEILNVHGVSNNSVNPKYRAIVYMRDNWLKENPCRVEEEEEDMFAAIRKYASENPGCRIELETCGDRYTAVLVTDFMLRVHKEFREAGEVVFVDTTWRKDKKHTSVTPLLCTGPAGTAPLGIIFSSSLDEYSYTTGFRLLKNMLGDSAFHGQGHPNCFITDGKDTEWRALKTIWPDSSVYLCIFHILQQTWQWLCDASHGIKKEQRPRLMMIAKELFYADTHCKFQYHWNSFCQSADAHQFPNFASYLARLVERQQEWTIMDRLGNFLHGHHTNNYAESALGIIKDIILNRCKSYNTGQLVLFISDIFNSFMQNRLLDMALGRKHVKFVTKNPIPMTDIRCIDSCKYTVKSQTQEGEEHTVDLQVGICDCTSGETGDICKHQIACTEFYACSLPQAYKSSTETRQWLAGVALGNEKMPSAEFFSEMTVEGADLEPLMNAFAPPKPNAKESFMGTMCMKSSEEGAK
ncbi:hypothetical protein Pmani_011329 [Petrolisthes manimaculis]|uniref:SWIM-type domain-containing protein n=1 Tax=Petrolisthes manimaculis TaxID=1843537 RepID=A0AAE1Q095_9EUCA|nr:hypothetical protein Pmani_011329 [Petrolisthes manimaculis]